MLVNVNINNLNAENQDIYKAFVAAFNYLNTKHTYVFNSADKAEFTINVSLDYFPIKSIDDWVDQNKNKSQIDITPDSFLVYKNGYLYKQNTNAYFTYFRYPILSLLKSANITVNTGKYIHDLIYVLEFMSLGAPHSNLIPLGKQLLQLVFPNLFIHRKLAYTASELITAKQYGFKFIFTKLGILEEPKQEDIIGNICFACVTSEEYTEPTYVFLHSMFAFNNIKVFKVYYVNGSDEQVQEYQKKVKEISPNIEVIKYSYCTKATTILHFKREYVDSKMSILDELTPNYDLTVMCDCDMLCQGSLKGTILSAKFKQAKIIGVKDPLAIISNTYYSPVKYINGGFIIYKKGNYNFKSRYSAWIEAPHTGSIGKYNEQDFINYENQSEIDTLLCINNFNIHLRSIDLTTKPKIIHYYGPIKPYQYIKDAVCNTIIGVSKGKFATQLNELAYFYRYYNYAMQIKDKLDYLFVKQLEFIHKTSIFNEYHNKVLNFALEILETPCK